MSDNFATKTEKITVIETPTESFQLKKPLDVERGQDGRLTQDSVAAIKALESDKQAHDLEKKEKSGMEAAMAQVLAMKDPNLAQIAAMTENRKDLSSASASAKQEQQKGVSV